jgi:3-hydroxymyristoyl/3-hydroxydecanoyl-(acyl carrier protein) dehydratase
MRYHFVDRILELQSGQSIVAEKLISHSEVRGRHFRAAQLLETMAQAAGWLAKEAHGFTRLPLLAKVPELEIRRYPQAGDRLTIAAQVRGQQSDCIALSVELAVEAEPLASARLLLYLMQPPAGRGPALAEAAREHFHSLTEAPTRRVLSSGA